MYVGIKSSLYVGIITSGEEWNSSAGWEGGAYGFEQRFLAEGFEQAINGALGEHSRADVLISMGRDEHDRDVTSTAGQLPLQVWPPHARHADIQDQTIGSRVRPRVEERLGRGESLYQKSNGLEQSL